MRLVIAALLAFSASAFAQAPVDQETAINVLRQQRNDQADIVAQLAARLASMEKELKAAQEKCKPEAKPAEKK